MLTWDVIQQQKSLVLYCFTINMNGTIPVISSHEDFLITLPLMMREENILLGSFQIR